MAAEPIGLLRIDTRRVELAGEGAETRKQFDTGTALGTFGAAGVEGLDRATFATSAPQAEIIRDIRRADGDTRLAESDRSLFGNGVGGGND